jgi:pimeloyl-ACP methyl ester carboxylesterase
LVPADPYATSADGVPVRYDGYGAGGPAIVFVHGWSCDRGYWDGQVAHFAERHRVVTVDLAGHGESGLGRTAWTIPSFGEDVVAVVDRLELSDMVLAGHSQPWGTS